MRSNEPTSPPPAARNGGFAWRMAALFASIALWSYLGSDAGAALIVAGVWAAPGLLALWGRREARLAREERL